jgi:hypothetical protein
VEPSRCDHPKVVAGGFAACDSETLKNLLGLNTLLTEHTNKKQNLQKTQTHN